MKAFLALKPSTSVIDFPSGRMGGQHIPVCIHRAHQSTYGSSWIRTSEGISQRIYSPPPLTGLGHRPLFLSSTIYYINTVLRKYKPLLPIFWKKFGKKFKNPSLSRIQEDVVPRPDWRLALRKRFWRRLWRLGKSLSS